MKAIDIFNKVFPQTGTVAVCTCNGTKFVGNATISEDHLKDPDEDLLLILDEYELIQIKKDSDVEVDNNKLIVNAVEFSQKLHLTFYQMKEIDLI